MPELTILLFDDARAAAWEPFTLTRPAGELIFGTLTFRERAERVFRTRVRAQLTPREHLLGFVEEGTPPVLSFADAPRDGDRLFLLSRALPDWEARQSLRVPDREGVVRVGGVVAGWFAPAGAPAPDAEFLGRPEGEGEVAVDLPGRVLENIWELLAGLSAQITLDIHALNPRPGAPQLPYGAYHWGEHPLVVHPTAKVEPGCAIDTSEGPVWIGERAVVRAFSRLVGPAFIGPETHVLGGSVECVSVGPACRVHGELSSSVLLGFSNKQHDGHMGHAYLGRWVNLGAETTNSDLKNNYGTIRLWTPEGEVDTGEIKLGCLLGDHVKTGIGLLLNTGTVVGAGSNLYGASLPPRYVPPFSWGEGDELVEYRVDKFLEVAERAMERRDIVLTEGMRRLLEGAFTRSRPAARTGAGAGV
jgi:UDP-N-acetylglucosamine diphosphorylase / glucose-1-phosphate thymidylyltransferase / UDP-N-acetylgalactosamine diphosphorylase / glucosamine-1-phosphate N-acetyltransferase / galactosamine-1-phosphate N-acetyltransferase